MNRLLPNPLSVANLRGDITGGLTAAIVALPLAVAFGVASGLGPVAGLYGAVCVGFFAAMFGGTPSQISGPTGPMTIVSAALFTQYAGQPAVAFTVVMLAGLFQVLFGYLRLGRYINLMPYPVISGFMTGIGCILIIMQLDPLLGQPAPQNVVNALTVLPDVLSKPNLQALFIGGLVFIVCQYTPPRIGRVLPPPLIALVGGTLLALVFDGAPRLGPVPTGLPAIHWPEVDFGSLNQMLVSAAVLAALGSIDSLLTSLVADNMTRSFHDSDKELVGQGLGNLVAGLFGGIPGAGATVRTLTNIRAGGRTCLAGMIHAMVLLALLLGLGPVAAWIPNAALAGVLMKVGVDVIDWRYLRRARRAPRADAVCMLVVLLLTVFVDVITAVAVGVIMTSLLFVRDMAQVQINSINTINDAGHRLLTADEAELFRELDGRALILHLSGPISFGASNEMMRRMVASATQDILIIDLLDVPHMDGSAALALEQIVHRAIDGGQDVIIVGLSFAVARLCGSLGVLDLIKETERLATRGEALLAARARLAARDLRVQSGAVAS